VKRLKFGAIMSYLGTKGLRTHKFLLMWQGSQKKGLGMGEKQKKALVGMYNSGGPPGSNL